MKTIVAIFFFAMVVGAMCQAYNYGYSTYTPGAKVSHYASSGAAVPFAPYAYAAAPAYSAYNYAPAHYGAYPYRFY